MNPYVIKPKKNIRKDNLEDFENDLLRSVNNFDYYNALWRQIVS